MAKKSLLIMFMVSMALVFCGLAQADIYTTEYTITGNASVTVEGHSGRYIYYIEVLTSADDAVTITIASDWGAELFSGATTAATGGEWLEADAWYPINGKLTITTTNVSSGNTKIKFASVK
jgi:hypothetical protein